MVISPNKVNNYIVECNGSACSDVAVSKDVAKIGFNISNIKFKVNAIEICTNALNKTQALKIGAFIGSGIQYIIFDKLDIQEDNLFETNTLIDLTCLWQQNYIILRLDLPKISSKRVWQPSMQLKFFLDPLQII